MQTFIVACGKFFAVLILFLPLFLNADGGVPPCRVCGHAIREGTTYLKSGDSVFCSEKCFEDFKTSRMMSCSVCGAKAQSGYKSEGKFYCSKKCFLAACPKCAFCGHGTDRGIVYNATLMLCEKCNAMPKCDVCMMPRGTKGKLLTDGLALCGKCLSEGIFDQAEAERIFNEVRESLKRSANLYTSHTVDFTLCDSNTLKDEAAVFTGDLELGRFICFSQYDPITGKVLSTRFAVKILHGLTRERFECVAAHEIAHDWMYDNAPHIKTPELAEGFAEYISWRYAREKGYNSSMKRIELNQNPVYGGGFRGLFKPLENLKKTSRYPAYFRSFKK